MSTSVDQPSSRLRIPLPQTPQPEYEGEDDVPHSLYICNARDAINIKMVYTVGDLEPEHQQRSFKPEYVFQLFGRSETIFGYRNLGIDIYFMANSANCFVDLKYNAIADSGPPPDNILQKLSPWLPQTYYIDKREFLQVILKEDHSKKFGKVIDMFETYNKHEEKTYKYIITECSPSEPEFGEFHSRFESLIVWFIDAASQIDIHDVSWMFFYVYERRKQHNSKHYGYYPVGYCTVYKFFHFPDKVRTRISQLFILPPCQRSGIGIKLLDAVYKTIYKLPNVIDIAVEDPCDAFTRMRDVLDCQLLMQLNPFRYPAIISGFTKQMFDEANAHFKFNKRQCRRAYEILRMAYIINRQDKEEFQRLYRYIKARIEAPYMRTQEAVKRKRVLNVSLGLESCNFKSRECSKDVSGNADIYFEEIKVSALLLSKRI